MKKRKVVDAISDTKGNITKVKIEGNVNFTSIEKAIEMCKNDKLEGVNVSKDKSGNEYLRTNADEKIENNLDELAKK